MSSFNPFISKIENIDDIFDIESDCIESKYKNLPLLNLGYHSFLQQVREKMEDSQLKERLFYLVVNNFEHKINDFNDDLESIASKYFSSSNSAFERSFFKLWEIIFYFDLIPLNKKDFVSANISEKDGSFLRSTLEYRKKFFKESEIKKDSYCLLTRDINEKMDKVMSECINKWKSNIYKYELKEADLNDETGNDGGVTSVTNIKNYIKMLTKDKKYADLVTCNGDKNTTNEVDLYNILLGEIITAINVQNKDGNLVIKIFDTFTNPTLKFICILKALYKDVFICKPLMSRGFKEERFLVCKGFKYSPKDSKLVKISEKLFDLLENINKFENIYDIFSTYNFDENFVKKVSSINASICNSQHSQINNIIEYKNSGNYFGDVYHKYRDEQIESTNWWNSTFFPKNSSDLIKNQKIFNDLLK